jgi:hypothetical protein
LVLILFGLLLAQHHRAQQQQIAGGAQRAPIDHQKGRVALSINTCIIFI